MTVDAKRWIAAAAALVALAVVGGVLWYDAGRHDGPTVGEKLAALRAERASLQALADGEARIGLLSSFRVAAFLGDALAARGEAVREGAFAGLGMARRQSFAELDALNQALKDAVSRPGGAAAAAARAATETALAALERLAGTDKLPLVLQVAPRFIAPVGAEGGGSESSAVEIEIVGLHLAPSGAPLPVLSVGNWQGEATVAPERLRFAVPRSAFAHDSVRTGFVTGSLALRRGSQSTRFELLFVALPDRPGSFALDQRIREPVAESRTLLSPELLARAPAGGSRTVRRCFDPPEGWKFDKASRRILVVERLGWIEDAADATLNAGTVVFAADETAEQICIVVTARPANRAARTATIGRFEVTLVRERIEDRVVRSGVRALGWREAVRVPMEPDAEAWKLYVRLFGEIDREFSGSLSETPPFLRLGIDGDEMVLEADPAREP